MYYTLSCLSKLRTILHALTREAALKERKDGIAEAQRHAVPNLEPGRKIGGLLPGNL